VDKENYMDMVREVCLFLEGKQEELIKRLTRRMEDASARLAFERAAELRDQLKAVRDVLEKQKVISAGTEDQDAVAMARGVEDCCVMVFFIRGGKLLGRERFILTGTEGDSRAEVLTAFIKQYYHGADFIPAEILVSDMEPGEAEVISSWLAGKKGSRVQIKVPVRGEKKKLMEMVSKNALLALEEAQLDRAARRDGSEDLALLAGELGLPEPPRRMECYDISNTQGTEAVASMVVFEEGKPASDQYRRFKIKTVQGPDDFASMQEVIRRRFKRAGEERELINTGQLSSRQAKFHRLPDMVIIDGGKGQLSAALEVMEELGYGHISIFGMAKEEELLFAPGRSEPIRLPRDSRALYLLQRLRDEAHRFAVTYHRQLRTKRNLKSLLDEIEGIGSVRRRELLKSFPSIEAMAGATIEELAGVPAMNKKAAEAVAKFFADEQKNMSGK
jgi:excinuclease ABC subunit C